MAAVVLRTTWGVDMGSWALGSVGRTLGGGQDQEGLAVPTGPGTAWSERPLQTPFLLPMSCYDAVGNILPKKAQSSQIFIYSLFGMREDGLNKIWRGTQGSWSLFTPGLVSPALLFQAS